MSIETLQQLHLSSNEAKIYIALLELNEAGVGALSIQTKIHRRNVYDAVRRLIDKGLAFPILSKGENVYSPVDPDKLLELIREKELELNKILPELRQKYQQKQSEQEAYIYRGIEGFKNYMRDILRVGSDVYFIGGKLIWFEPRLKNFTNQFFKEAKRKKMKFQGLFDAEVKTKGQDALKYFLPSSYKFLSAKYSSNATLVIFGDYVVSYTVIKTREMDENITIFVLRDKYLAEGYRTWFRFMFKR